MTPTSHAFFFCQLLLRNAAKAHETEAYNTANVSTFARYYSRLAHGIRNALFVAAFQRNSSRLALVIVKYKINKSMELLDDVILSGLSAVFTVA